MNAPPGIVANGYSLDATLSGMLWMVSCPRPVIENVARNTSEDVNDVIIQ